MIYTVTGFEPDKELCFELKKKIRNHLNSQFQGCLKRRMKRNNPRRVSAIDGQYAEKSDCHNKD